LPRRVVEDLIQVGSVDAWEILPRKLLLLALRAAALPRSSDSLLTHTAI